MKLYLAVLVLVVVWPAPAPAAEGEGDRQSEQRCIKTRKEARYIAYGYDHRVFIKNVCDKPWQCTVRTNTSDQVHHLAVAAGKEASVRTHRGSPAREFEASVKCKPGSS